MKKLIAPIATIVALTGAAIAVSAMTAPEAKCHKSGQSVASAPAAAVVDAKSDCCSKAKPVAVESKPDCCAGKGKPATAATL